jgi:DNA polymerase-3 subunit beta
MECIDEGEDNLDGASRKRHVRMTHGTSVFRFETMVLANFPIIPDAPLLTLEIARFRTILERVFFATSNYESSYVLNGALMKITSGKLELIATDGHRMNLAEMPIDAPDIKPVLLSRSALEWIIKSGESDVSFGIGDQFHAVRAGSKTLIFRYKTGQFPNYEAVIPSKTNITATFKSTREFKKKLALVSEFSDPRSGAVIFNFGHESTVSAKSADVGSATTTLDCAVDGELRIGVCSTYVFDILNTVEDEELTVQFTNEQSAAMFILDGTRYLVMPMRI